jgi:hypothetical protein
VGEHLRWVRGAMRAWARPSSGVIHADIDVANDLPRNGPSGSYSKRWMSRALQSLTSTTPKRCSAASSIGIGPVADGPQT